MRHILVVCTANQCRSPMAEGLIRARLAAEGRQDRVSVASAGTWADDARSATPNAVATMAARGIDIADPVGGSLDDYRATADELLRLIDAGWAEIVGSFTAR